MGRAVAPAATTHITAHLSGVVLIPVATPVKHPSGVHKRLGQLACIKGLKQGRVPAAGVFVGGSSGVAPKVIRPTPLKCAVMSTQRRRQRVEESGKRTTRTLIPSTLGA